MNKYCPILKASLTVAYITTIGKLHETTPNISFLAECGKHACEWYGNGCPAFPTSVSTEVIKQGD